MMSKKFAIVKFALILVCVGASLTNISPVLADDTFAKPPLYDTAYPYVKYFLDRSLDEASGFKGLTLSFQIYLGGHTSDEEVFIKSGAAAYDQDILGRILLENNDTVILDTYISYFKQLSDVHNPLLNTNGAYYDADFNTIPNGPYRIIRILGRDSPAWWSDWDWAVDTGAAACLTLYSLDAYQRAGTTDYKDFAVMLGEYLLRLQDTDGGLRYGPRGMYHETGNDFYWNLKSTEQNERALLAFTYLYQLTADVRYDTAAAGIKGWLKGMYDITVHLYHSAATYDGALWQKTDFGYVATDVIAFAPLELMFNDTYFGATQDARDEEVAAMFAAIESRTAFLDTNSKPKLFRFSVSQSGDYGSVEWSAQMALAYLRVAQIYAKRPAADKAQPYLDKYNALVSNLEDFFAAPGDDAGARVAPYASYLDYSVAGGVPTGTGYYTYNCQAALASVYYAFAKAGYDPTKLGGGDGIPQTYCTLNLTQTPWYGAQAPNNSSGAATAQMIINFMRKDAVSPYTEIGQSDIFTYAKDGAASTADLNALEVDRALGHFDPYDQLVSNWSDSYDAIKDGNPYQGYNFAIRANDPQQDPEAINKYMRDICHWMAYTVTKEDWWKGGALVAHPNTPAAVPLYGSYDHWGVVKGYAVSAHPCPNPHTNPQDTPDFTVYGLWIKDPKITGIGKDTYKTASECRSTYFRPLATTDGYNGMYLQVAEPPLKDSKAKVVIKKPVRNFTTFKILGLKQYLWRRVIKRRSVSGSNLSLFNPALPDSVKTQDWKAMVDAYLLMDKNAVRAFAGTTMGKPVAVKREDRKFCDYFLVPFGKADKKGKYLVSAAIIIDAHTGHFKEASWTSSPEQLLPVDKNKALVLIRKYLLQQMSACRVHLKLDPASSALRGQLEDLYYDYLDCLVHGPRAPGQLLWSAGEYSASVYRPYWKISVNWSDWLVTQEGKVYRR